MVYKPRVTTVLQELRILLNQAGYQVKKKIRQLFQYDTGHSWAQMAHPFPLFQKRYVVSLCISGKIIRLALNEVKFLTVGSFLSESTVTVLARDSTSEGWDVDY